jgi:uncharacterized Tic20 family protein
VLNLQITMTLLLFASAIFMLVGLPAMMLLAMNLGDAFIKLGAALALLSVLPLIIIGLFSMYQGVVNAVRSLSDRPIHYRLSIPFVK